MKRLILGSLLCLSISGSVFADESQNAELKAVNDEVERRITMLRDNHNIIVTQTDENNIKKQIIVEKLKADDSETSAQDKADKAIETYEVTDPVDQRDIIIMYAFGGGDGTSPPN